jgi:hypothetical protein
MPWEVFARDDFMEGRDTPFVSVGVHHIGFNTPFARIAELRPSTHVTISVDSENLRIGFEFHDDNRPNSFLLSGRSGSRNSFQCASQGLTQKHIWIGAVARLGPRGRRFSPKKEGKLWVIQLCPAFEERRARESADIPSDARGIYRYVRESGEIVYIGRGEIKKRLSQPERQDWDFDRVEYSVVANPDQQVKWEDYWITRFKETNKGKLPIYNKISGASGEAESEVEDV